MTELKYKLQRLIETITGKRCKNCKHHNGCFCDSVKKDKCSNSIFPVGWEKKKCAKMDVSKFKNKADFVEVVRCEKCKRWIYMADKKRCYCELHHYRTNRDDFCSYGKRNDENV